MSFLTRLVFPVALGAALAYYLDPKGGTRRRNMARDKAMSLSRRGAGSAAGAVQQAVGRSHGAVQGAAGTHAPDNPNPDDKTLTDRVESVVFADPSVPKGDININTADGIVELRGELKTQQGIDDLVRRVQQIPNVKGVHNYLHLPGTPAPNKASVLKASK